MDRHKQRQTEVTRQTDDSVCCCLFTQRDWLLLSLPLMVTFTGLIDHFSSFWSCSTCVWVYGCTLFPVLTTVLPYEVAIQSWWVVIQIAGPGLKVKLSYFLMHKICSEIAWNTSIFSRRKTNPITVQHTFFLHLQNMLTDKTVYMHECFIWSGSFQSV